MQGVFKIPNDITQEKCDELVADFYSRINKAMIKAIPKSQPRVVDNNNPWWTNELQAQRRKLDTLYKHKAKKKHPHSTEIYNRYRNTYKKNVEKARKQAWEDYKEKIGSIEEMSKFRKIVERRLNIQLGALEKEDGTITEPGKDTLRYLSETHFSTATAHKDTQYDITKKTTKDEVSQWNPDWVTKGKLVIALNQFKSKKSPGPDGIKPILLKHLPDNCIEHLLFLYKTSLLLTFTPTAWKGSRVVFIPNPGKDNYKKAKSWRPISLTNYMIKAPERLCGWHMDEALKQYPLHDNQHGFRSDRNTDTALSSAANYIEKHIYQGEHVIGVFLDIQAAFDTIDPAAVKDSLLRHGGDCIMVNWYHNCITHRNIFITINGEE